MPALLDFLYQEYCRARLAEMRKQLLLSAQNSEARDVNDPVGHADRDCDDDRTTGQHEARIY